MDLSGRRRQEDLPGMHMPCQDDVILAWRAPVDGVRKVGKENAKRGVRISEGWRSLSTPRGRTAHDVNPGTIDIEPVRGVFEEHRTMGLEIAENCGSAEGVTADVCIVIAK